MANYPDVNKSKLIRAAEWLDALPGRVRTYQGTLLFVLFIILAFALIVGLEYWRLSRSSNDIDTAQKQILDDVQGKLDESQKKVDALEAELFEIREQLLVIDDRIESSIEERDKTHDDINKARGVTGVNAVLKKRNITTTGNTEQTARSDTGSRGVHANPYK